MTVYIAVKADDDNHRKIQPKHLPNAAAKHEIGLSWEIPAHTGGSWALLHLHWYRFDAVIIRSQSSIMMVSIFRCL